MNGRAVKQNGGGTTVLRATKEKFEVALEILKRVRSTEWGSEFSTEPPTRLTTARIRDKFEAAVTVRDVHKQQYAMYGAGTVHTITTQVHKTLCST
jgi:hypothetical protein